MSDNDQDETKPGGNKKLIVILGAALAVVLVAAVVVVMTFLGGSSAKAEPDPTTVEGSVHAMEEPMTLNLSDGKFLKLNLALQMTQAGDEEMAEGGHAGEGPDLSPMRDAAINVLSRHTYDELLSADKRGEVQKELSTVVKERYHEGSVMGVYFTEFVMQ